MSAANYNDLPCLTCCTRGCTDTVDDDMGLVITLCVDCDGSGYLNAAQAERQRANRVILQLAQMAVSQSAVLHRST